jgi:hypothetical protein
MIIPPRLLSFRDPFFFALMSKQHLAGGRQTVDRSKAVLSNKNAG